jgi:ferrous iron transport protein A
MPLSMADTGKQYIVQAITGNDKARAHLQTLGFTQGAEVVVVSEIAGSYIINVRDTRIGISRQLASKIMVA